MASEADVQQQLQRLRVINQELDVLKQKLDLARVEHKQIEDLLLRKRKNLDVLLARKFKTRVGFHTVDLEKLMLRVDEVDSLGGLESIRSARKPTVRRVQDLLLEADEVNQLAKKLIVLQEQGAEDEDEGKL